MKLGEAERLTPPQGARIARRSGQGTEENKEPRYKLGEAERRSRH